MSEKRPSPEKFLTRIKEEEVKNGILKIYLGSAPGVGKTYSMLQDAISMRAQGIDVVAGVIESHGRGEIDNMLKALEILPRRIVEYHGKPLLEFDLNAALRRAPALILIDEMAHTNVPGLTHIKRWQDIKELLDRGIDVHTTLNVQHIESLNDVVAQVVGIRVRETVPDSILEAADSIEIVDLPPSDLLKRLQEGKVYIPAQAELATQHFFRKGNLIALRELALRFMAERVDKQVLSHRQGQGIQQTWPIAERLLVCVGADTASAKMVRAARRMASSLRAEWIAVHVDAPRLNLSEGQRNNAIKNLRLAEQLGAQTRILTGVDVVKEIIHFAREHNVTKIITSKRKKSRWKEMLFGSLLSELIRHSGDIDVYAVHSDVDTIKSVKDIKRKTDWPTYGIALIVVALVTGINLIVYSLVEPSSLIMSYMLGVVIVAMRGRIGPAIVVSILSAITYTLFFVSPHFQFVISDLQYIVSLFIMAIVGLVISHLTISTRQHAEIAHLGELRTAALHALSRQLASTRGVDKLLDIAVRYIAEVFDSEVWALLPENGKFVIRTGSISMQVINEKDLGVVQWVYDLGQVAGLGTNTLPFSDALYVPLLGAQEHVGVLKVRPRQPEHLLIPEQLHLLEACANQIALAIEVDRLQETAKASQVAIDTERLRTALFSSLSLELRDPLAGIYRQIHLLKKKNEKLDMKATHDLIRNIHRDVERLNRLVNNLLQISQLEEGKISLNKSSHSMDEIIKNTLSRIEKKLKNKQCNLKIPTHLPPLLFDKVLIEQVLVNLIENAILYTPPDVAIEISASLEEDNILISVADHGPGILLKDLEKIFEKFYRGETSVKRSGAGLGLSVCQSIIRAHGGRIWAENHWQGGAVFHFLLPLHDRGSNLTNERIS